MEVGFNFDQEFDSIFKSRLNKKMGQYCLTLFLKNFTKEGYLDGNGSFLHWKALKQSTINSKESKGKGNYPINVDTALLKRSFNIKYKNNGFDISNIAPYAGYVQAERPILYTDISIDQKMIEFIDEEMSKLFAKQAKKLNNK